MLRYTRFILSLFVVVVSMLCAFEASAQRTTVEQQRKRVEQHKRDLERSKKQVEELKKQKGSATERVDKLTEQMNLRTSYIAETERKRDMLDVETTRLNLAIDSLAEALDHNKRIYAEVVRAAHRNYKTNNETTYLFSSTNISEAAHRMVNLRHVAEQRAELAERIREQGSQLLTMREELSARRQELDSIGLSLETEHRDLERDREEARRTFDKLSEQERKALKEQQKQQKELDKALKELRKLTENNKVGKGFSASTKALNLPVAGGKTHKMQTNMVKITGKKGDIVRSIYEGKIVRIVTDNTNHYTVMVAHGHYVSVYTHLSGLVVAEGDVVKRNEQIGVIGIGVDHNGAVSAYMQFMIINTKSNSQMNVMDCFKK